MQKAFTGLAVVILAIMFAIPALFARERDITTLSEFNDKTYAEMVKRLGPPADKMTYTVKNAPTKSWNHGELFSRYPKNSKYDDIQIVEVVWEDNDFSIYADFHMVNDENRCFIAKRIRKGVRF